MTQGTDPRPRVPVAVLAAGAILALYGLWLVRIAVGALAGPTPGQDAVPPVFQLILLWTVAYGIVRTRRWAWFLGLFMPLLLVVPVGVAIAWALRPAASVTMVGVAGGIGTLVYGLGPLVAAIALLLLPTSRAAFRPGRPTG